MARWFGRVSLLAPNLTLQLGTIASLGILARYLDPVAQAPSKHICSTPNGLPFLERNVVRWPELGPMSNVILCVKILESRILISGYIFKLSNALNLNRLSYGWLVSNTVDESKIDSAQSEDLS